MWKSVLLALAVFSFLTGSAQLELSIDSPDLPSLELLTFNAVNDLRLERKLEPLSSDEVLYRAAKDQADYLIRQKNLVHEQSIKEKSTPYKRVKLHGGLSYSRVGENLVSVTLGVVLNVKGRKLSTQSYLTAARTMAQVWKRSPPHYRNILQKAFNVTAVAISYDPLSQRVVAVQVFGFTAQKTDPAHEVDHSKLLLAMPDRKLPFGLKEPTSLNNKDQKAIRSFMALSSMNGMLFGSYKTGKKAFRGRRSALANEAVPLAQFDSGAVDYNQVRNRRNGQFGLNGELSKPIYRRTLLKFSRQTSPRRLLVNLRILKIYKRDKAFLYPTAGAGSNVFLIRKKKLITYITPLAIPAALLDEPMPALKFENSFSGLKPPPKFRKVTTYDSLEIKVFYPSAVVTIDTLTMQNVIELVGKIGRTIISVEAAAYASIDGDMAENHELSKQRAENFISVVQPFLDSANVVPTVKSKEQWDLFSHQIKKHNLSHLKNLHPRRLREYVNAHKSDSLITKLLAEQRFTLFSMVVKHDTLIPLPQPRMIDNYRVQKRKFQSLRRPAAQAVALEQAQLKAYAEIIANNNSDTLEIVRSERFPNFQYHNLLFRYLIRRDVTDEEFYQQLHHLSRLKYLGARLKKQMRYNNLVFIYSKYRNEEEPWHMLDPDMLYCNRYRKSQFLLRLSKSLKCWRDERLMSIEYYMLKEFPHLTSSSGSRNPEHADSLAKYYTTSMIRNLYAPILPKEIYPHLVKIKHLYHPDDKALSIEERVRLAFFYCAFRKLNVAEALLAPVADDPQLDPEGKKLFITLQADSFKEQHEYINYLIAQYASLGQREWCSIWTEGEYLSHLLLEDQKLKAFYNCNCQ